MDGFLASRRRFFEALFLGLIATGACHLPPLHLAARLDGALYDAWSRIDPPQSADDILLIRLDDSAGLSGLARLAHRSHARLLITTLPHPPSADPHQHAIGPVEVPVGETRLRRTGWLQGGHLWFRPELDGIIRHDWPLLDDGEPSPSLAFYAATLLAPRAETGLPKNSGTDSFGRRWLRFYAADAFTEVAPAELLASPGQMQDKVLIAGRPAKHYRTSVGELSAGQLLAHVISGYRQDRFIEGGRFGPAVVWSAVLLLLLLPVLRPLHSRAAWWSSCGSIAVGLPLVSATAFVLGSVWLPIAGASILLLATGAVMAVRAPRAAHSPRASIELVEARRLVADGLLEDAWRAYRQIPPGASLLAELYDLACALDSAALCQQATDLFHRVAQVDGRFRDVGRRLVRSGQPLSPSSATVNTADRDRMPKTLGRYELLEPIGRGAMGNVYLGRDPKINRIVAIKAIDLAVEYDPAELDTGRQHFLREAETAGRLSHPNIVTIFDVGEAGGLAYIAMEYLRGRHLSEFAAPNSLLPLPTVLELFSRTADALNYAHEQNVVHRDIKPANIMYDSISDGLKITDFGIARLIDGSRTRTGIVLGTPAFMSPEQLEGKNVNGHTDLFALGVSLYQLLTGHLPFRGASMTKLMFVIANEPHQSVTAVRSDLPDCLNPIVDRALAKNPADRFQTGAEMAAALRYGAAQIG